MTNQEEFDRFWSTWRWPDIESPRHRLYYDDQGHPVIYTMEDLPGKYIQITADQYARASFQVRVVAGQLHEIEVSKTMKKLRPSGSGVPCHPNDVTIVVGMNRTNLAWSKK